MDKIIEINSAVNGFVWGPIMLALLVGTGIYLSFRVGFIQFSKIGYWWKNTIGKIFQKSEAGEGEITPMQAVSTALASTVGTGNIAGVTGAIILGGPGAVFWMWISALFGMVTKFAEVTLAVKYRERNEKGDWCGGPMYYIKNGLGPKWKWLGVIFSVFGALAAFGIGNISQINSIASSVNSVAVAFHENAKEFDTIIGLITGVVIAIFVALVLLGGVKRIGQVTEKLVPGMAAIYIVCALVVVIANAGTIPGVFASIFQGAFNPSAVVGGAVGVTMKLAITKGVGRGVFSNEAGLGSAPIAHAATSEKNPVRQGLYGIFEVFMDTIVICTLTSLVVLCSGAATGNYGNNDSRGRAHRGRGLCQRIRRQARLPDPCRRPAALRHLHHPRLGALRHPLRGVPLRQQDHPPLSGSLLPRRHRRLGRQPQAGVGHLRHSQRPHGDPEPHRHPAAQPRGHQADEGALQRREGRQARISEHPVSCGGTDHAVRPAFRSPGEKRGENAEYFRRFPFTIEKSRGMISKRVKAREEHTRT